MQRLLTKFKPQKHYLRGFTITELVVVITVSGILMAVLFGPLNELYADNTRGLKSVVKIADTKGALRRIEQSITLSHSFYANNPITDPTGANWNWRGTGTNSRVLITGNYATDIDIGADTNNERTLVRNAACSAPLRNYNVYFVSSGTLYRRTIKNTATTCAGSTIGQKQTCPPNASSAPYCEGTDAAILSGVTKFTVDYFANSDDDTPLDAGGTPPHTLYTDVNSTVPTTAKSILITLTATSGPGSLDTTTTSQLRVTRVNGP